MKQKLRPHLCYFMNVQCECNVRKVKMLKINEEKMNYKM